MEMASATSHPNHPHPLINSSLAQELRELVPLRHAQAESEHGRKAMRKRSSTPPRGNQQKRKKPSQEGPETTATGRSRPLEAAMHKPQQRYRRGWPCGRSGGGKGGDDGAGGSEERGAATNGTNNSNTSSSSSSTRSSNCGSFRRRWYHNNHGSPTKSAAVLAPPSPAPSPDLSSSSPPASSPPYPSAPSLPSSSVLLTPSTCLSPASSILQSPTSHPSYSPLLLPVSLSGVAPHCVDPSVPAYQLLPAGGDIQAPAIPLTWSGTLRRPSGERRCCPNESTNSAARYDYSPEIASRDEAAIAPPGWWFVEQPGARAQVPHSRPCFSSLQAEPFRHQSSRFQTGPAAIRGFSPNVFLGPQTAQISANWTPSAYLHFSGGGAQTAALQRDTAFARNNDGGVDDRGGTNVWNAQEFRVHVGAEIAAGTGFVGANVLGWPSPEQNSPTCLFPLTPSSISSPVTCCTNVDDGIGSPVAAEPMSLSEEFFRGEAWAPGFGSSQQGFRGPTKVPASSRLFGTAAELSAQAALVDGCGGAHSSDVGFLAVPLQASVSTASASPVTLPFPPPTNFADSSRVPRHFQSNQQQPHEYMSSRLGIRESDTLPQRSSPPVVAAAAPVTASSSPSLLSSNVTSATLSATFSSGCSAEQRPRLSTSDHRLTPASQPPRRLTLTTAPQPIAAAATPSQAPTSNVDCYTCRRRRVKCDRRLPLCAKCERTKLECLGYKKPLVWNKGVASRGKMMGKTFPAPTQMAGEAPRASATVSSNTGRRKSQQAGAGSTSTPTSTPPKKPGPGSASAVLAVPPLAPLTPVSIVDAPRSPDSPEKTSPNNERPLIFEDVGDSVGSSSLSLQIYKPVGNNVGTSEETVEVPSTAITTLSRGQAQGELTLNFLVPSGQSSPFAHLSEQARYYMDYFEKRVARDFVLIDRASDNPYRILMPAATHHPAFLNGILAVAARHHSNLCGTPLHTHLRYKGESFRHLHNDLQRLGAGGILNEVTLAVVMLFIFFETLDGGIDTWKIHLRGARRLIRECLAMEDSAPEGTLAMLRIFMNHVTLVDIIGRTLAFSTSSEPVVYDSEIPQYLAALHDGEAYNFLGCPAELLEIIHSVTILKWRSRASLSPVSSTASSPDDPNAYHKSCRDLLSRIESFDVDAYTSSRIDISPSDPPGLVQHVHSYRCAAHIYGIETLFADSTTSTTLSKTHAELRKHLDALDNDSFFLKGAVWLVFVAGTGATNEAQREWTRQQLNRVWHMLPQSNIKTAGELLEQIWAESQDTGESNWRVLERGNKDWLFI